MSQLILHNIPFVDVIGLSKLHCKKVILGDLKYASHENFVGRVIAGYSEAARDVCLLAPQAAQMLCHVQNHLVDQFGYGLIIYDAFRPLRAVADFASWFEIPPENQYELMRKEIHYPHLKKQDLPQLGYVAKEVSRHCFGRAVDLTLISIDTLQPLDMGACYDFFDDLSHSTTKADRIGQKAYDNRLILINVMEKYGFYVHEKEYWHFDYHLQEIPSAIDGEISPALKNWGINTTNEYHPV